MRLDRTKCVYRAQAGDALVRGQSIRWAAAGETTNTGGRRNNPDVSHPQPASSFLEQHESHSLPSECQQHARAEPLAHRALEHDDTAKSIAPPRIETDLADLLPASRRTPADDLITPANDLTILSPHSVLAFVDAELDLGRLADIHDWRWIAGRPMPPRPLHQQRLFNREILITERLGQHLVWGNGRMFIKPLPRFLLEPRFWGEYLPWVSPPGHFANGQPSVSRCRHERALSFLFSYTALIAHESDFHIAKENHLLPQEVGWQAWRAVVREILDCKHIYSSIDPRFHYGELRLSRLNKTYFLWKTPFRAYMSRWNEYSPFFGDNFVWLASSTIYIAVVLTAMQVGLGTELQDNDAFQSASYGFTIFSILGALVAIGLILVVFFGMFIDNWVATRRYLRKRMQIIES